MTGAQIPEGADAVVMFEQTVESETTFTIRKPFEHFENVSLKGKKRRQVTLSYKRSTYQSGNYCRISNLWL